MNCVHLDCQMAFDTVPYTSLVKEIKLDFQADIKGIIGWIKTYLNGRKRMTHVGVPFQTAGIPQGSVLGPTIVLIYVNALPRRLEAYLNTFPDDVKSVSNIGND